MSLESLNIEAATEDERPIHYEVREQGNEGGLQYLRLFDADTGNEIGAIEYVPYKDGVVIKMMNVQDAYRGKYFGEKLIEEAVSRFGVVYTGTEADTITAPASHLFRRLKKNGELNITDHEQGRRGSAYVNPQGWKANKFVGLPMHLRIARKQTPA